ncbi:MAG TPA: twin-arginine translocation signal domain-containing protein, partial [Anaerolineae bacterium]|nr:twin-arginine translocation signal domain-containing protein [Anaerolineae bacterium]
MTKVNRRNFLKLTGSAVAIGSLGYANFAIGGASKKVVIVGGGIGGATAARY